MSNPRVSVCLITYNHEKYIRDALESIISQKTNFPFEVIVCNDKSTDNTESIIKEYLKSNSNIRYFSTDKRLGAIKNWIKCLNIVNSDYFAVIEGDDYWTDSHKLQKQFDFMEQKPEYSFCFHKLETKFERLNDNENYLNQNIEEKDYTIEDIITKPWFIGTCSIFARKLFLPEVPHWINGLMAIDRPLQLILASNGKVGFINENMGVWRVHNEGISQIQWLGKERTFEKSQIQILKRFNTYSNYKYSNIIYPKLYKLYNALFEKNKDYKKDFLLIRYDFLKFRIYKYIRTKYNNVYTKK